MRRSHRPAWTHCSRSKQPAIAGSRRISSESRQCPCSKTGALFLTASDPLANIKSLAQGSRFAQASLAVGLPSLVVKRSSAIPPLQLSSASGSSKRASRAQPAHRPRRLARPRTSPFHGGNTGSNPVGDANFQGWGSFGDDVVTIELGKEESREARFP